MNHRFSLKFIFPQPATGDAVLFRSTTRNPPRVFRVVAHANRGRLDDNLIEHLTADVGKLSKAASMEVTQLFIVQSHQVENRGMDVTNGNGFVESSKAEFIGFACRRTAFDIPASHPHGEGVGIMFTTGRFSEAAVLEGGSAHLRCPDDQRFLQKTSIFEIRQ